MTKFDQEIKKLSPARPSIILGYQVSVFPHGNKWRVTIVTHDHRPEILDGFNSLEDAKANLRALLRNTIMNWFR